MLQKLNIDSVTKDHNFTVFSQHPLQLMQEFVILPNNILGGGQQIY